MERILVRYEPSTQGVTLSASKGDGQIEFKDVYFITEHF